MSLVGLYKKVVSQRVTVDKDVDKALINPEKLRTGKPRSKECDVIAVAMVL